MIRFATPLATKPNVIRAIGPIPATTAVTIAIAFLVPSPRLLNFSNNLETNSTIGVAACKNAFPTGTKLTLSCSILFWNLILVAFSTLPSSRSDKMASSSIDAPARSSALEACDPSFVIF